MITYYDVLDEKLIYEMRIEYTIIRSNPKNIIDFILLIKMTEPENTIDDEWTQYLLRERNSTSATLNAAPTAGAAAAAALVKAKEATYCDGEDDDDDKDEGLKKAPTCDELNISTHTKTLYLNQPIDTSAVFWKIPIIDYGLPAEGVVNKHMKVVMHSEEEVRKLESRLSTIPCYKEHIIRQVNIVHSKRPKYKDERKITIGISKKDILNTRKKQKGAFMNCFAMIVRFLDTNVGGEEGGQFREVHVKVFKTGNLEIPGVLSNDMLAIAKRMVLAILQPIIDSIGEEREKEEEEEEGVEKITEQPPPPLEFVDIVAGRHKSVLINSNFRCGYFIDRDLAYQKLRNKYGIDASYDPCSYPGVKCKFYFNHDHEKDYEKDHEKSIGARQSGRVSPEDHKLTMSQLDKNRKYTSVTFTLFRTGSCLISGNCDEHVLFYIYDFVCKFLREEYANIRSSTKAPEDAKPKKVVLRKRTVRMTPEYFEEEVKRRRHHKDAAI